MAIDPIINNTTALNPTYANKDEATAATTLDKDSFMTLLLTQLQNQDPTSPTDTDTILSQTADLATLEAQENTKSALEDMVSSFQSTSQYALISSVGKLADTGVSTVTFDEKGEAVDLEVYMTSYAESGNITIKSSSGEVIRKIPMEALEEGQVYSGLIAATWDGKDEEGNSVDAGSYTVTVDYTNLNGNKVSDPMGRYLIESVKVSGDTPQVKLAGNYYDFSAIQEILERATTSPTSTPPATRRASPSSPPSTPSRSRRTSTSPPTNTGWAPPWPR